MQPTDHKPPSPSPLPSPSLHASGAAKPDSRRILANLERGDDGAATPRLLSRWPGWASWPPRRSGAGLLLVLVLALMLAGAAWWRWRDVMTDARSDAAPALAQQAAPSVLTPAAVPAGQPQPAERLAAAIVNEAVTPVVKLQPAVPAVASALTPQPGAPAVRVTPPVASPMTPPMAPPITSPNAPVTTPAHNTAAAAEPHHDKTDNAGPRVRPAPAAPLLPTGPADNDVVLLTALVAHANGMHHGTPNRDVVLRKDGDLTDTLLQRCKALGPIEGMLCRSRICSGRWDEDAACSR